MVDSIEAAVGIYLATFVIAMISSVFPLINSEVYLIGIVVATPVSAPDAMVLGVIVACGQIVGHSVLFHAAHGAANLGGKRRPWLETRIERARTRVASWGNKRTALLICSAVFGLPPFLLTCLAAGVLEIRFRAFVTIGLAGRMVRFATIGAIAALF